MKVVQQALISHQGQFAAHPFFARRAGYSMRELLGFAPRLTFWVMAFQDVLRLNESLVTDVQLNAVVQKHREEDAGHDRWFLHDMQQLGVAHPNAVTLFGREHQQTRDAAYALIAEALRAADDRLRVVLLLALEAAGHVFFARMSDLVEANGLSHRLKYFSHHHFDLEKDHHMFAEDAGQQFEHIILPTDVRDDALAMVARAFGAFDEMFNGLLVDPQVMPACDPVLADTSLLHR